MEKDDNGEEKQEGIREQNEMCRDRERPVRTDERTNERASERTSERIPALAVGSGERSRRELGSDREREGSRGRKRKRRCREGAGGREREGGRRLIRRQVGARRGRGAKGDGKPRAGGSASNEERQELTEKKKKEKKGKRTDASIH